MTAVVDLNAGKQRPLEMYVARWQLDLALADLGPDATVADLEAFASDMFQEKVTVTIIEDPA